MLEAHGPCYDSRNMCPVADQRASSGVKGSELKSIYIFHWDGRVGTALYML